MASTIQEICTLARLDVQLPPQLMCMAFSCACMPMHACLPEAPTCTCVRMTSFHSGWIPPYSFLLCSSWKPACSVKACSNSFPTPGATFHPKHRHASMHDVAHQRKCFLYAGDNKGRLRHLPLQEKKPQRQGCPAAGRMKLW